MSNDSRDSKKTTGFWLGGVILLAVVAVGSWSSETLAKDGVFSFFFWALFLFGGFTVFLSRRVVPHRFMITLLLVLRVLTWLSPGPNFSDDIYRYIHEARASRISLATPYSTPPKDIVPSPDDGISAKVNHPEVPAAYPPFSQLVLIPVALLGDIVGYPLRTMQVFFWLLEVLFLLGLYSQRKRFGYAFVVYGLHPLPLLEVGINAHLDILGVMMMMLGVYWLLKPEGEVDQNERRKTNRKEGDAEKVIAERLSKKSAMQAILAGLFIGFAVGVKPIALLAVLAVPMRFRKTLLIGLGCVIGMLGPSLPYLLVKAPITRGLVEYSTRWESAPTGFALMSAIVEAPFQRRHERGRYTHLHFSASPMGILVETEGTALLELGRATRVEKPLFIDARLFARAFMGALFLMIVGGLLVSRATPMRRTAYAFAALWLLAPTVHPWYFLWMLPFAVLSRSRALWWWAAAAPLSYEVVIRVNQGGEWVESPWPRGIALSFLVLGLLWDEQRKIKVGRRGPKATTSIGPIS